MYSRGMLGSCLLYTLFRPISQTHEAADEDEPASRPPSLAT